LWGLALDLENAEEVIAKIASESGRAEDEIRGLVEKKKAKFSGLLTDSGAAIMVAKELNVNIGVESALAKKNKVSGLKDGMANIDLVVRVLQVFPPKEFEKAGKKGVLCNLVVGDETGEVRLTLWHGYVKKLVEKNVKKGDVLLLKNCFVSSYNQKRQVSLGYGGEFFLEKDDGSLPQPEPNDKKIDELEEGMNDVSVIGRIGRIFPVKEFERDGGTGKVANFEFFDSGGKIRATAWNDSVAQIEGMEGKVVRLEGAYTKKGLRGVELHLGWRARVVESDDKKSGIPKEAEAESVSTAKKISELHEGDKFVEVNGRVVEVLDGRLFFNACPKCGSKATLLDEKFVCDKCGEVEAKKNPVLGVMLDDTSAQMPATFFGEQALQLLGMEQDDFEALIEAETVEKNLKDFAEKLDGKEVVVRGYVRKNNYSGETEIVAKEIEKK